MPGSRHGNAAAKAAIHRPAESVALISVALISCLQITATVGIRRGRIPAVVKRPTVVERPTVVIKRPAMVTRRPSTTRAINGTRRARMSAQKGGGPHPRASSASTNPMESLHNLFVATVSLSNARPTDGPRDH